MDNLINIKHLQRLSQQSEARRLEANIKNIEEEYKSLLEVLNKAMIRESVALGTYHYRLFFSHAAKVHNQRIFGPQDAEQLKILLNHWGFKADIQLSGDIYNKYGAHILIGWHPNDVNQKQSEA